jgi:hypothetical protein
MSAVEPATRHGCVRVHVYTRSTLPSACARIGLTETRMVLAGASALVLTTVPVPASATRLSTRPDTRRCVTHPLTSLYSPSFTPLPHPPSPTGGGLAPRVAPRSAVPHRVSLLQNIPAVELLRTQGTDGSGGASDFGDGSDAGGLGDDLSRDSGVFVCSCWRVDTSVCSCVRVFVCSCVRVACWYVGVFVLVVGVGVFFTFSVFCSLLLSLPSYMLAMVLLLLL